MRGPASGRSGPAGAPAPTASATWLRSPCLGLCERAPAAMITVAGDRTADRVAAPVDAVGTRDAARTRAGVPASDRRTRDAPIPQAGQAGLRLLARIGVVDPTSLDDYRATGGFRALERARAIGPRQVIDEVDRVRARRPRRGRVPDRPEVGGRRRRSRPSRTTSSATPTSRSRGRSRIAS